MNAKIQLVERVRDLPLAVDGLCIAVGTLEDLLSALEGRLGPVLRYEIDDEMKPSCAFENDRACPLGSSLETQRGRIAYSNFRIEKLLDRLELP